LKYRAEIDGLRALAVVPVILSHAGFELFSGGFVGVDVFFVISGYLITTILIEDIESKRFSIVNFYERRARRILPALFFVMFVCIPFAWMWMLPSQMKDFSQSLVAVSLFASNILFWRETGYFSAAAEEKPLLHTWSLAVEEQYYLLFPIFLLLAWRFGKNRVFWMIVVMAAISLLVSEWGWRNQANANFYLAPTRAWELFAGSIAAFIVQKQGVQKNNSLATLGLAAIVFSIFFYDETTPFPSVYALVPVLGVVLLVLYADKETLAAKLLSTKGCVGVGLISYSAYLWHQPIFAFARIRVNEPTNYLMALLALLSIGFAYFSWKLIEVPFRNINALSRQKVLTFSFSGLILFSTLGFYGHFNGLRYNLETFNDWRDTDECVYKSANSIVNDHKKIIKQCLFGKNDFILVGDSHAESLSKELRFVIEQNGGALLTLLSHGCFPIPQTSRKPYQTVCVNNKSEYWDFIESTNANVIISTRWRLNLIGDRFDNQEGGIEKGSNGLNYVLGTSTEILDHTKTFLQNINRRNVFLINQIPEAGWNVPDIVALKPDSDLGEVSTSYSVYEYENKKIIKLFSDLKDQPHISIIEAEALVCSNETRRCLNSMAGKSLYRDDDHPSSLYSEIIARELEKIVFDE
jgi:peptidoglycan/LPS O-acetylase OafA/YrhL